MHERDFPAELSSRAKYYEQTLAERVTRALLSEDSVPALYEAAFSFNGIRTRVDILARAEGGRAFDLIEVKSSTRFKEREHLPDVSIQLHVLEGAGVPHTARLPHAHRHRLLVSGWRPRP